MTDTEPEAPATQVTSLDWISLADLYNEPEAVLAHLRVMVEAAEARQSEQRVPGSVVIGVRAAITTEDLPRALKG